MEKIRDVSWRVGGGGREFFPQLTGIWQTTFCAKSVSEWEANKAVKKKKKKKKKKQGKTPLTLF